MLEAIIGGLALGGVYALAAGGLIMGYRASGILNFAYAAIAYFVARFYYFVHEQHGWNIGVSAVVSIVIVAPAVGLFLWVVLFRFMRLASPLIKIVVMVGLAVALPPIAILLFGNIVIVNPAGLAPQPVATYYVAGAAITMDQIITYACVFVVLVGGAAVLRFTKAGLFIRATVDSESLAGMSGVKSSRVAIGVWAASTFIAGLSGVLIAPTVGLSIDTFTVLIAAAFAAVVAAQLRNLGVGVLVGFLMGIATDVVERYLPSASQFTTDVIPSIPFIFMLAFLLYFAVRGGSLAETQALGSALDRAVTPGGGASQEAVASAATVARASQGGKLSQGKVLPIGFVVLVGLLPFLFGGIWLATLGLGIAYGVVFLSYTISAGEGGMIWLCQITFAGIGGFVMAELAVHHGWPILLAMLAGGVVCAFVGAIIGFLTIRLGDLYVALVTLTFGLLIENLVFQLNTLYNNGAGIAVSAPHFAIAPRAFDWMALAIFVILVLAFQTLRRSTFGLAVGAVRWSEIAARTSSLSVLWTKVLLSAIAAFVAGVGGGLLSMYATAVLPGSYFTFLGLTWLAVVVTIGVRTSSAALLGGLSFALIPVLFSTYLPSSWDEVPAALFGLGAVMVARNPGGALALQGQQIRSLIAKVKGSPKPLGLDQGAGGEGSDVALDALRGGPVT